MLFSWKGGANLLEIFEQAKMLWSQSEIICPLMESSTCKAALGRMDDKASYFVEDEDVALPCFV